MTKIPPLDDPAYRPLHPPIDGRVPEVVARWGPRSQVRWFNRFRNELAPQRYEIWDRFYCSTVQHRGSCCPSCIDDEAYDSNYSMWPHCCCRALS